MRMEMGVAGLGSVVGKAGPRTRPSGQTKPGKTRAAVPATPSTVKATRPKARRRMLTKLNLKSRQEVSQAAAYRSGDRTTRKITSGFKEIVGMPGMKLMSKPETTGTRG